MNKNNFIIITIIIITTVVVITIVVKITITMVNSILAVQKLSFGQGQIIIKVRIEKI